MPLTFQFIFFIVFFPCALLSIKENEELIEVEKDRHSSGRSFFNEENVKKLDLQFPEQLTLIEGSEADIQFIYRFFA